MKVASVELRTVAWSALASNARLSWDRREGVAVTLRDDLGRSATGIAAPLPGFARDTLDDARASLGECAGLVGLDLRSLARDEPFSALLSGIASPSARCAVETSLAELGQDSRWTAPIEPVPRAALVTTIDESRAALARGASTLKVKIGHVGRLEDELLFVRAAAELAPVRVDANGTLDERGALLLAGLPVEFVEEPGAPTSDVPIALDESLLDPELDDRLANPDVVAIVLKPMVLGGILECLALARRAAVLGVEAIASHSFDGPMSRVSRRLAQLLPPTRFAHGIPERD